MKKYLSVLAAVICLLFITGCGNSGGSGESVNCTISIDCSAINKNIDKLDPAKKEFVPENGIILAETKVVAKGKDTCFEVLRDVCEANGIPMESSFSPLYKSYYIEGINNLYEFDCGANSGWMFSVNGEFPNYGCSEIKPEEGDVIKWVYTCDLGSDVGGNFEE